MEPRCHPHDVAFSRLERMTFIIIWHFSVRCWHTSAAKKGSRRQVDYLMAMKAAHTATKTALHVVPLFQQHRPRQLSRMEVYYSSPSHCNCHTVILPFTKELIVDDVMNDGGTTQIFIFEVASTSFIKQSIRRRRIRALSRISSIFSGSFSMTTCFRLRTFWGGTMGMLFWFRWP